MVLYVPSSPSPLDLWSDHRLSLRLVLSRLQAHLRNQDVQTAAHAACVVHDIARRGKEELDRKKKSAAQGEPERARRAPPPLSRMAVSTPPPTSVPGTPASRPRRTNSSQFISPIVHR